MSGETQAKGGNVRPLTTDERELLDSFLRRAFLGVDELRTQVRRTSASPGCTCGCGTIDLHVPDDAPLSAANSPVPVEGTVVDADGEPTGGLILFVDDGRLSCLEVYSFDDDPLPLPPPKRVRWYGS